MTPAPTRSQLVQNGTWLIGSVTPSIGRRTLRFVLSSRCPTRLMTPAPTGQHSPTSSCCGPTGANVFEDTDDEATRLRAAAVGLRRLAQLDTAIGDPGNLRLLADTFDLPILRRIADAAVLGSGEQPEEPVRRESIDVLAVWWVAIAASSPWRSLSCVVHARRRGCWEQPEGPPSARGCGSERPTVCPTSATSLCGPHADGRRPALS
jgi:hypothetical protein